MKSFFTAFLSFSVFVSTGCSGSIFPAGPVTISIQEIEVDAPINGTSKVVVAPQTVSVDGSSVTVSVVRAGKTVASKTMPWSYNQGFSTQLGDSANPVMNGDTFSISAVSINNGAQSRPLQFCIPKAAGDPGSYCSASP